jgi:hypothetical protein
MPGRLHGYLRLVRWFPRKHLVKPRTSRFRGNARSYGVRTVRRSCSTPADRVEPSSGKTGSRRAVHARPGRRRGWGGHPVLPEPFLGAVDSRRRDRPSIRDVLSEVPDASTSAAAARRITAWDAEVNPGLTPESGRAAPKGDAYLFGFSSDAADRPCPWQMSALVRLPGTRRNPAANMRDALFRQSPRSMVYDGYRRRSIQETLDPHHLACARMAARIP